MSVITDFKCSITVALFEERFFMQIWVEALGDFSHLWARTSHERVCCMNSLMGSELISWMNFSDSPFNQTKASIKTTQCLKQAMFRHELSKFRGPCSSKFDFWYIVSIEANVHKRRSKVWLNSRQKFEMKESRE